MSDTGTMLKNQFEKLPSVVQDAILGAHVEDLLKKLSKEQSLHLDQWQLLENVVMRTLLGIEHTSELPALIEKEVNVEASVAKELAAAISKEVFDPIRDELERILEHPEAEEKQTSDIDKMAAQTLGTQKDSFGKKEAETLEETKGAAEAKQKVLRPTDSEDYRPGQLSYERKDVVGDPYRETP